MVRKEILVPGRLRRPPATGWSWMDRRFLREHGDYLSREAMLLYFFLASVADRHGLSFYSGATLSCRLRMPPAVLAQAREELRERDLIAHQLPLVQVLSLPPQGVRRRSEPGQGLCQLGDVFRQIADAAASVPPNPRSTTPASPSPPSHDPRNTTPAPPATPSYAPGSTTSALPVTPPRPDSRGSTP